MRFLKLKFHKRWTYNICALNHRCVNFKFSSFNFAVEVKLDSIYYLDESKYKYPVLFYKFERVNSSRRSILADRNDDRVDQSLSSRSFTTVGGVNPRVLTARKLRCYFMQNVPTRNFHNPTGTDIAASTARFQRRV